MCEATHAWHRRQEHGLFAGAATFGDHLLEFPKALLHVFRLDE
jgi:hypothetical protein